MENKITELEHTLLDLRATPFHYVEREIDLLNALAWELRGTAPQQALQYSQEARALAETASYSQGEAYSYYYGGVALRYLAKYEDALSLLLRAYDLFYALHDEQGQALVLNWLGNVYLRMGNYSIALDYYLQSLHIHEEDNDTHQTAINFTNIGRVYYGLHNYESSLMYHLRSLRLHTQLQMDNAVEKAVVFWDISRAYCAMKNYRNALQYCQQSLELNRSTGNRRNLGASYYALGEIYVGTEDAYHALLNFLRAIAIFRDIGEVYGEANASLQTGIVYFRILHNSQRALEYLHTAINLATDIKANELKHDAHQVLAELYKSQGQYREAFEHFECFYALKLETANKQTEQAISTLQRQHEIEKRQKEAEIYRLKNVELANALSKVQTLHDNLAQVNIHLEKLNQEKTEFIGIVAHDLQNPLAGISMTASLIKSYAYRMQPDDICEYMDRIESTADRMKEIVVNLLNLDAIESGKMHLIPENISIPQLLRSVIAEYIVRAKAKSIALHYVEGSCTEAFADKHAVSQVLDNLVSNAIKYSPKESNVWLSTDYSTKHVSIYIRDEGPGFTTEDKAKLFGKFTRLSAKPTGGEHSTGLGLSIVKKIVDAIGGTIECQSATGCGTTFALHLPIASSTHVDSTAMSVPPASGEYP